jgi:hypothetical protein
MPSAVVGGSERAADPRLAAGLHRQSGSRLPQSKVFACGEDNPDQFDCLEFILPARAQ